MNLRSILLRWREWRGLAVRSRINPHCLHGLLNDSGNRLVEWSVWSTPGVLVATALACLVVLGLLVTIPFTRTEQLVFSLVIASAALYIRRYVGTFVTLVLVSLSVLVSTRYLYWRFSTSMQVESSVDLLLGLGLLAAEFYAWIILIIGFFQTIWPLKRKPVPMPQDLSKWPTVDVFIPSYNEPLSIVMPTVIAALAMDWPREKLKVHLLDDGRRDDFREFAASVDVTYMTRSSNVHAKAGNINAALPHTDGELIAIVDCDHIPARTFLQATAGLFLQDRQLAMVQTPRNVLSPDPFERKFQLFRLMPNEAELSCGPVQDGNDLWNAAFFCGSCAVVRRTMLLEIGGVAVETVTEDAHTALKLQRLGYSTAYLGVIQAAGLAAESLSAHVGQRIRWARGTAQILRIDNPLFGKGLRWPQRLCYLNAVLHLFYGLPRVIFLTAPLSYLLFEVHIIQASADLLAVYALPHLIHAGIANSRVQGSHRHPFWAEVYETALAWYIMVPSTLAMINPKWGQFNVTAQGGKIDRESFDWKISLPYLIIVALNLIGIAIGFGRLFWWNNHEFGMVLFNLLWTAYNLTILVAILSIALESRQVRPHWRIQVNLPAMIKLPNGRTVACEAEDFSDAGLAIKLPVEFPVGQGSPVKISIFRGEREFSIPAAVVFSQGLVLRVRFEKMNLDDYRALVAAMFSRANAWKGWLAERDVDRRLPGLREVLGAGIDGFGRFIRRIGMTAQWRRLEIWKK